MVLAEILAGSMTAPNTIELNQIRAQISELESRFERQPGSVRLLAVSKGQPLSRIEQAVAQGHRDFGENYVDEALNKMSRIEEVLEWHFIGPLQSNKSRAVAEHFAWVQSVDRLKLVRRLGSQRPQGLAPLNVLIQVNLENEAGKRGAPGDQVGALAHAIAEQPRLRLRGLMSIPPPQHHTEQQREQFARVHACYQRLVSEGFNVDTLSMGMSGDLAAAIAEGATMVRIGTALFGRRLPPRPTRGAPPD